MKQEESTPLMATSRDLSSNGESQGRPANWKPWRAVLVLIVLLLASVAFVGLDELVRGARQRGEATKSTPAAPLDQDMLPEDTVLNFRPFCNTYFNRDAKIIQTSLGQPSQQWSPIPCFPVSPQKAGLFGTKPVQDQIDHSFQYPDAIIQVNFTQPAFTNRSVPILGFGGAFTEASAINYNSLSQNGKDAVMELLFGRSGLGYSLGRVHINSCDFSVKSYSFDDTDGDFDLHDFDIHHDVASGMIEMMLKATSVFQKAWGTNLNNATTNVNISYSDNDDNNVDGKLQIFASPWSPPAWMKAPTPDDKHGAAHAARMTNSAQPTCLRDGVGPDSRYAKAWAKYFAMFLSSYEALGVKLWAVSIQNEPEFPAPWEACSYTPKTELEFLKNHLGPALRKSHPHVKIFIFDHNKDHAPVWVKALLNSTASQYVDGTAIHWYAGGMDRLLDGAVGSPNMHRVLSDLKDLDEYENHVVFGSEACHCPYTAYGGGDSSIAWARAERYAHTILADLAAGSTAWVEWNLILDSIGGPNHLGNLCDTTILAVPHRALGSSGVPGRMDFEHTKNRFGAVVGDGRTREELNANGFPAKYLDVGVAVQPMYFYMGHISRYVRPGSSSVMGIVNMTEDGKPFRPKTVDQISGGGINDLARNGVELTVWPCEGSTRQHFKWNDDGQLQVLGHDWLGNPSTSCLSKAVEPNFRGLILGTCNTTLDNAGVFEVVPHSIANSSYVNFRVVNGKRSASSSCLAIQPLRNHGGALGVRGGSQVTLGSCSSRAARWSFKEGTGEMSSSFFEDGEVCMTTGWPFLQMGAFHTPNGESDKTVIVLNEAAEPANYILRDDRHIVLTGSIPPHSIQTILLDY